MTNQRKSAIIRFVANRAGIAQLVEQLICNQQVGGSSPSTSSTFSLRRQPLQLHRGAFPSGQRGQTVNLLSTTSVVRIHPLPPGKKVVPLARPFFLVGADPGAGLAQSPQRPGASTNFQIVPIIFQQFSQVPGEIQLSSLSFKNFSIAVPRKGYSSTSVP